MFIVLIMKVIKANLICMSHFFHQLTCALFEPEWLFSNINLSLVVAKEATNCIRLKRHFKMEKQIPFWQVNDVIS